MRILATVAMVLAAVGSLSAQAGAGWVDLQGASVRQSADKADKDYKTSSAYGIGLGGWFTNWCGAEVSMLDARLEPKSAGGKGNETHTGISGLVNLNPGGAAVFPFLRLGAGIATFKGDLKKTEGDRRSEHHAGLGVQGFLGEHFLSVLEFREVRVGRNASHRNETMGLLGLGYRWGGSVRIGKTLPAGSETVPAQRPIVEELTIVPQKPAVEAVPASSQRPAIEVAPAAPQKPAVEALPTPP